MFLGTLKPFDYIMIGGVLISSLVMNIVSVVRGGSFDWLGFFAAVTGVIGNVLVARGNILNYFFGAANVLLYAIIAFITKYYGNAALNLLYYLPMQFIGWHSWTNARKKDDPVKVQARRMTWKEILYTTLSIAAATAAAWALLRYLKDSNPFMDAVTTILSMAAMFMMIRIYAEQWYLWITINVISIVMWIVQIGKVPYAGMMIIMWTFYLINSINGLVLWLKDSKA
jgi:nicotinamide mononucleotide transporter